MGLLDLLRTKAAPPPSAVAVHTQSLFGQPPRKGTREVLLAYRASPWLRAAAGKIATGAASIPLTLAQQRGNGEAKPVEQHPALTLLAKPNRLMTGRGLREQVQLALDLVGEAFVVKERNLAELPAELYYVPPHWVTRTPTPADPTFLIHYPAGPRTVPERDVIWIRDHDPFDPYGRGSGLATALADELDTDEFAAKQLKAFFYNSMIPGSIISAEGMTQDQAKQLKADMEAKHRGFWNAFKAYFAPGKVTVQRLDSSFKDMQLVQLRQFARDIVVQVFGVPPELLGILENSNRATIDAAFYLFALTVLVPRHERVQAALQLGLVDEYEEDLVLGYVSPVPADKEFALKAMQQAPAAYSVNELRLLTGHSARDDGDEDLAPTVSAAPVEELEPGKGGDPAWARRSLRGAVTRNPPPPPPAEPAAKLTEADVEDILEQLRAERLTAEVDPVFAERVEEWSKRVLEELGASAQFALLNPKIAEHLREFSADRIKGLVDDTTRQQLRDELLMGVRAGEDIDTLITRVMDVFDQADELRAEAIARTEVIRSSNWATYESQKISGVVDTRKWVATRDSRTRESHKALDGSEAKLDEAFAVDGKTAMYPGGFGEPEEDINCRCTTVAVIKDPEPEEDGKSLDLDAVWTKFDADVRPWETAAEAALKRGFSAQRKDVLAAVEAKR